MKGKRIILISIFLIMAIISIQSVMAENIEEINIENSQDHDDLMIIDNGNIDNQYDDNQNDLSESLEDGDNALEDGISIDGELMEGDGKLKVSNSEPDNLQSTIEIDGKAYNQMANSTIQTAINNANPGDTIVITGKEYVHCHFIINKKLTIISEVSTVMSPCPSNTDGSGAHGIFYIGPEGSGTIIKGFVLNNDVGRSNDYGIYIKGASNVEIINCTINQTPSGSGIKVQDAQNTKIANSIIKESNIGINLINSIKTSILNNAITNNSLYGIHIAENNQNTTIDFNNITYNKGFGISAISANYIYITNNFIAYNQKDGSGAGVYVNCNITKIEIKGNFFKQNGQYGVLNDYRARNMDAKNGAEKLEIINNNYFLGHSERLAYHIEYKRFSGGAFTYNSENDTYVYVGEGNGDYDVDKSVVYLGYAFFDDETICGATLYKAPSTTWSEGSYKLQISEISQLKKGTYQISIVDKNGNIATDFNSIYVTFYLNKNNSYAEPQEGDIYRTVLMKNGTATASFSEKEYLESQNVLTAVFPGLFEYYTIREKLYKTYSIEDSQIPKDSIQTIITVSNMKTYPNSGASFTAALKDGFGTPLAGKIIKLTVNGKTYTQTTDAKGEVRISISLPSEKTYTISVSFNGDEEYKQSSAKASIAVKRTGQKITSSNKAFAPNKASYYSITLKDSNNKPIANKNVKFTINKKTYTVKTNSKGVAKVRIKLSKKKTYKITIKSARTNKYEALTKTNRITIKALKQKIISSNKVYAPKSVNYYTITLKDQNNAAISKKKITIKVGKKTYKKKTNKKGEVKLKIKFSKKKTYKVSIKSPKTSQYKAKTKTNKITIEKGTPKFTSYDRTYSNNSNGEYSIYLRDYAGKALANGKISFSLNGNTYNASTDANGIAKFNIKISPVGTYSLTSKFLGDAKNKAITKTNSITIKEGQDMIFIDKNLPNNEIQRIIDSAEKGNTIEFLGDSYDGISLTIKEEMNLITNIGTQLKGLSNSPVLIINGDNINVSNFKICPNSKRGESDGILINNSNNVCIANNIIVNQLDSNLIDDYNNGSTILPGTGIKALNSETINLENNIINSFESGIYNEYSRNISMKENEIRLNNYGIKYGFGSENSEIINNTIIDNIGWYTEDVPEGPRGYGIFLNNSAVNILIRENNISNNYIGISIDSNNSTGIVVTSNLIADNSLEGIRFNAGYDLAENCVEPNITNNAIYRNAEGPSMMILGEMSANPFGIYGPGQWDESLKLQIGPNWYGVNSLRTWDNDTGIVGVGTMCPRIKTSEIKFETIESETPGSYKINFYKDGELASNLAQFDLYATLNRGTDKETEVHFNVINGTGSFSFDGEFYLENDNKIEISAGSLINIVDRLYSVVYTYNVPAAEIPV